jgi:hypothetical protein
VRKDCATLTSHKVVSGIYKEPLENWWEKQAKDLNIYFIHQRWNPNG